MCVWVMEGVCRRVIIHHIYQQTSLYTNTIPEQCTSRLFPPPQQHHRQPRGRWWHGALPQQCRQRHLQVPPHSALYLWWQTSAHSHSSLPKLTHTVMESSQTAPEARASRQRLAAAVQQQLAGLPDSLSC